MLPTPAPQSPTPDTLSTREHEIATLVAQGWTNQQIAEHLFIAEATVKTHVRSVLQKLNAPRRAAIGERLAQIHKKA